MKISEIYKKYKIMPNLQEHMLRVAAVASIICDNFDNALDKNSIISACLLHDMGNIVKFNLKLFPDFRQPEGIDYWTKIQQEFRTKYGNNDYEATYKILNEININQRIVQLIKSIEFAKTPENIKHPDFESKICLYSDLRVGPKQIMSLNDRLAEVKERYKKNKGVSETFYNSLVENANILEKQIFKYCKIKPEDITEEKVKPLIEKLRNFNIEI